MSSITASVGASGDNLEADVRLVQSLLNRQDLSPLGPLAEDGRAGSATIEAIRHSRHVWWECRLRTGGWIRMAAPSSA